MTKHSWLAALALAGCEQAEVKETAQPPVAQAPAPAPAPPAAPTPAAAPVLTAQGYGPLRIGMSRAEVEAAPSTGSGQGLGADANPEAVGGPEPESCDQFRPARAPQGMLAMVEDRRLTRL